MEQVKDLLPLGTLIEIAIPKSKYSKKIVQVEAEIVEYRNGKAIVKVMEGVRKGSRFRLDPDKHHFTFAQKFERW